MRMFELVTEEQIRAIGLIKEDAVPVTTLEEAVLLDEGVDADGVAQ
jgi:hypothetical protein